MFDRVFYDKVIKKELDYLIGQYTPKAVYLTGSFTTQDMWILGASDIDIKIIGDSYSEIGQIDVTDQAYDYFGKWKSTKDKVYISFRIYDIHDFEDDSTWENRLMNNDLCGAGIISDQVLLNGSAQLLYGEEVSIPKIRSSRFRKYINLITPYLSETRSYDVYKNLKDILRAIKLFYYLWNDEYVYDNKRLIQILRNKDDYLSEILVDAMKYMKDIIGNVDKKTSLVYNNYFIIAKKVYNKKLMLHDYLTEKDEQFCNITGDIPISWKYIECQDIINE